MAAPAWSWPLLGAPLVEEVIFRTGLQSWLATRLANHPRTRGLSPWWQAAWAIALTSLVFAAAHVARHPDGWSALTVVPALLLGVLYQVRRRLTHCVLVHASFNGLWMLAQPRFAPIELLHPWMS